MQKDVESDYICTAVIIFLNGFLSIYFGAIIGNLNKLLFW